jgi:FkbM family methyltransferase
LHRAAAAAGRPDLDTNVLRSRIADIAMKIPPFNRLEARIAFVRRRSQVSRMRRKIFERFGSARYSRPALFEMDRQLERHIPLEDGLFVEAGANDGFLQSNTYYLEMFKGWTGVLIEPIPELCDLCRRERPNSRVFNCALVPEGYPEPVVPMLYGGLMSVVAGARGSAEADHAHVEAGTMLGWDRNYEVLVPARTLSSVLEEAAVPEIDFLSLDVEGFEADVLRGLDFDRFAPLYMLVEVIEPERHSALDAVLAGRYEEVAQLSPHDVLLRRK